MTLSCLCGRALLVLISLRLVLKTGSAEGKVSELVPADAASDISTSDLALCGSLSGFTFCGLDLGPKTAPVFGPCIFTDRPFASHDVAIRQYLMA